MLRTMSTDTHLATCLCWCWYPCQFIHYRKEYKSRSLKKSWRLFQDCQKTLFINNNTSWEKKASFAEQPQCFIQRGTVQHSAGNLALVLCWVPIGCCGSLLSLCPSLSISIRHSGNKHQLAMFSVLEGRDGALWTQPSLSKYCGHKILLLQACCTLLFPWEFQVLNGNFSILFNESV